VAGPDCQYFGRVVVLLTASMRDTGKVGMRRVVFGVTTWPEPGQQDFQITEVLSGESDADAIERAKSHYSSDLECYIKEVSKPY